MSRWCMGPASCDRRLHGHAAGSMATARVAMAYSQRPRPSAVRSPPASGRKSPASRGTRLPARREHHLALPRLAPPHPSTLHRRHFPRDRVSQQEMGMSLIFAFLTTQPTTTLIDMLYANSLLVKIKNIHVIAEFIINNIGH
ncbi:hypothetical protein U9M48_043733 [Paspalum notatum var. saurae]|uniref:Uncharacterized protein n=1 Tax=Paspalum notatum var. saurae TaxID=547442 RepID=A0AAQ3UV95_PASNO